MVLGVACKILDDVGSPSFVRPRAELVELRYSAQKLPGRASHV